MQLRCPTCRAPWRQAVLCSRCGSDLSDLMQVAMRAWEFRQAARQLVCEGTQPTEAVRLARAACQLQATPQARQLLALALLANQQMSEAHEVMMSLIASQEPAREDEGRETDGYRHPI
jgi:predicted amidophosphoribosyltransferase